MYIAPPIPKINASSSLMVVGFVRPWPCTSSPELSAEHGRDVLVDDGPLPQLGGALLCRIHLRVLLEVLNVFGVCKVLELCIVAVVPVLLSADPLSPTCNTQKGGKSILLPVMDLVLVLIVPVVARPRPHIR